MLVSTAPAGPGKRPPLGAPPEISRKPLWATFTAIAAGLALAGWAGYTFSPSQAEQIRNREIERFRHMEWNRVDLRAMPADCFGYQPCVDRRQALSIEKH